MNIRLPSISRQLIRDSAGNVGVLFALAMLPIIAMVGMGIDYGRAVAVKTRLQAALDATALAMSFNAPSLSSTALTTQAKAYFSGVFATPAGVAAPTISISYSTASGPQIVMTASTSVNTFFVALPPISKSTIDLATTSTVAWGNSRLRVALVLDNTGSMAQSGKITALQTATKNLLAQLKTAAVNNGDVYVSIIPFVEDVNVGSTNYNATWIDWTDWDSQNGTCAPPAHSHSHASTLNGCNGIHGNWAHKAHSVANWNGCVSDRGIPGVSGNLSTGPSPSNYDTNVVLPTPTTPATLFPTEPLQGSRACPLQMMGLTYDWAALNTVVNQMSPNGSTNQNIGLAWGWLSLVGGGPLTAPPMSGSYQYQQVIILLTDGLNTQDRWYGNGSQTSTQVDARQQITCNNIKAAGITLYTVQVNTDGAPTSTLLQNCATDASKFFLLTNANEIITTFNSIGTQISKLRIAQ